MPLLTVNGAQIFYDVAGPADGGRGTIVFIHGLMLASDSWQALFDRFAVSHCVVRFDLRGQGRSDHTTDRLDLDSLADDTAQLIEALGLAPCHLIGFSMGSFIAMRVAARWPDRVRSLLLIGASANAEERRNAPRYALMLAFVRVFGPKPLAGEMMKILFGATFLAAPEREKERAHWRSVILALPKTIMRAAAASASRGAIFNLLPSITVPTFLITGSEDRPTPPALAARAASAIRDCRLETVAGVGHAVMLERPEEFAMRMEEFLGDVEKPVFGR